MHNVKLYEHGGEVVFGTYNITLPVSDTFTIKRQFQPIQTEIFAIEIDEHGIPTQNRILKTLQSPCIFFFNSFTAKDYLSLFALSNHIFCMCEEERNWHDIRKETDEEKCRDNWKITTPDELKTMVFDDHCLLKNYYFRHFPTMASYKAFMERQHTNDEVEQLMSAYDYAIFTDGAHSCEQNVFAWAFVVYAFGQEIYFDHATVNRSEFNRCGVAASEYIAMCKAHQYILSHGVDNVIVFYDNTSVMEMCSQHNFYQWKEYVEKTRQELMPDIIELNRRYCAMMSGYQKNILSKQLNICYMHSRAHSGIKGNERADALANQSLRDYTYVLDDALTNFKNLLPSL